MGEFADFHQHNEESYSYDDLDALTEPEDDPGPEYYRRRAIAQNEGILRMGEMADYSIDEAIFAMDDWTSLEREELEERELPPLKRFRKSKRLLPKGLQKHSDSAFHKTIGIPRRKWSWLWLRR